MLQDLLPVKISSVKKQNNQVYIPVRQALLLWMKEALLQEVTQAPGVKS